MLTERCFPSRHARHAVALILALFAWLVPGHAVAHPPGHSFVYVAVTETEFRGQIDVDYTDVDRVIPLDADGDGTITDEEFDRRFEEVAAYLQPRLVFYSDGVTHPITITGFDLSRLRTRTFALIKYEVPTLTPVPDSVDLEYVFLFDSVLPEHRGMVLIQSNPRMGVEDNEGEVSLIVGPDSGRVTLSLIPAPWHEVFGDFVRHGIWHIWIGLDHILFLISLLLPAVVAREAGRWRPVESFRQSLWYVVKVVTLFTLAHSITLSLAALKVFTLPERHVEAIIALSIAAAAANNIFPIFLRYVWLLVFGFGLFHGFGFANVLAPLGLNQSSLVTALVAFNVGVELGQIAIIVAVFPLLFALRRWRGYETVVLKGGSAALILLAMYWVFERLI